MIKTENFKFFQHRNCEYFPCHKGIDSENFNCLFCYCPLYALGRECGGHFSYNKKGIKDCTGCTVPHVRENYEHMTEKAKELVKRVQEEKE